MASKKKKGSTDTGGEDSYFNLCTLKEKFTHLKVWKEPGHAQ